ncbi:MAG: YkgJ family cysteine cluster protein [Desulfovibrio sp.]|nr:YkgJ family cysteine cluster protein [Desulfovibrio sp.]
MIPDLSPIFSRYEKLRAEADNIFKQMSQNFPDCVTCAKGCSDCCHALFDLSLVEAMYINRAFKAAFDYGAQRSEILTRAAATDRKLTKYKRELFLMEKNGAAESDIMAKAAEIRSPCPLLDDNATCLLYEARPITCRLYGIPTVIKNQGHVCGFSKFSLGNQYPTVHLDKIQARLEAMSAEIATTIKSRFTELDQVYVPLSMALLTEYDEQYLGIGQARED